MKEKPKHVMLLDWEESYDPELYGVHQIENVDLRRLSTFSSIIDEASLKRDLRMCNCFREATELQCSGLGYCKETGQLDKNAENKWTCLMEFNLIENVLLMAVMCSAVFSIYSRLSLFKDFLFMYFPFESLINRC